MQTNRPLRLVYVSFEYPPQIGGGIGTYVDIVTRGLARQGHRVTVVTVGADPFVTREFTAGMEVVRLPHVRHSGPEPLRSLAYRKDHSDRVGDFLERFVEVEGADVIEFPDYLAEGFSYLARTTPGKRPVCVVRLHCPLCVIGEYNTADGPKPVLEALENEAMLLADRIVAPPGPQEEVLRRLLPRVGPMDIVRHPADPALLDLATDAGEPTPEAVFVGRLEQRKGVEQLVRAAPEFLDACPGARLVLIGGDAERGASEPSMRSFLGRLVPARHADRVVFTGRMGREDLFRRLASARVCVFPSLFENGPYTCLEAMSLSRPCIGSDYSGMRDMIEDGVSGRLVRAGDDADLARTLIDVYSMPEADRRKMGAAARERVRGCFHADRVCEQIGSLYAGYAAQSVAMRRPIPAAARAPRPPRVAVVIPCYNHGAFVREAVESARGQTHTNVDVVVVDDGSTVAGTLEALDRLRGEGTRVIRQDNAGLAAARNAGIRATDAEFFVPLDADDLLRPGFIEYLLAPLAADPSLGYAYCHAEYFGSSTGTWRCPEYNPFTLLVANLSTATALVRRSAFDLAGGYAESMLHGMEDWDLWLSLLQVGYRGRLVPQPLFMYRQHAGGSMLSHTQRHRPIPVRQIVERHAPMYLVHMESALTEKDSMFFREHMDAWRARCTIDDLRARLGLPVADHSPDAALRAHQELEQILGSRAWRAVARLKSMAIYRAVARARFGRGWDAPTAPEPPDVRLAQIKASRPYRLIQRIKGSGLYRWYARRSRPGATGPGA
ncbi:MAG: glycosyltransferase [Phycisphaeraceae bacterium]|nr:glycosyltransferase [Phycisphaeraceae bacterium]